MTQRDRLRGWAEIMQTANPPANGQLDVVGKWLVITRAAVFPLTIWSGLIGGLLAVEAAREGDAVLLAGKGHEDYQIVGAKRHHFDDREEARAALGMGAERP